MKDNPFFLAIVGVIILGFLYVPLRDAANKNKENQGTKNTSYIGTSAASKTSDTPINNSSTKGVEDEIKQTEKEIDNLNKNIENQADQNGRSPYYDKVRLSSVIGLRQSDPGKEYITLSTSLKKDEQLKITGWYLKSAVTGYYAIIGGASILPFPSTYAPSDIVLLQGDKAVLTKGFSPIGISFRTNKCTGYFEEHRTFYPSLPQQCPLPKNEDLPVFSSDFDRDDECIKLIEKVPRCTTRNREYLRDLPDTVTNSCKTYISTEINYDICVSTHYGDTDFPGNEYRVFFNKLNALWRPSHDTINLYDENNLIVATIKY